MHAPCSGKISVSRTDFSQFSNNFEIILYDKLLKLIDLKPEANFRLSTLGIGAKNVTFHCLGRLSHI